MKEMLSMHNPGDSTEGEDLKIEWIYSGYCRAKRASVMEFSIEAERTVPFDRLDCVAYDLGHDLFHGAQNHSAPHRDGWHIEKGLGPVPRTASSQAAVSPDAEMHAAGLHTTGLRVLRRDPVLCSGSSPPFHRPPNLLRVSSRLGACLRMCPVPAANSVENAGTSE